MKASALIHEQPEPSCRGSSVSFTASLSLAGQEDSRAVAEAARNWARKQKARVMRDFSVLEAYGKDASYAVVLAVEGAPSFPVHRELGNLGFRLDRGQGHVAYRLALISNWNAATRAAAFEQALEVLVPRVLPLQRCSEVATGFVECFARGFDVSLDYSAASLVALSRALLQHESGGLSPVVYLPTTVIAAGCYLGEVLIREVAGSAWMEREDEGRSNFMLGQAPFNPWLRMLDLCVRGTEAALSSDLKETLFMQSHEAWAGAWD